MVSDFLQHSLVLLASLEFNENDFKILTKWIWYKITNIQNGDLPIFIWEQLSKSRIKIVFIYLRTGRVKVFTKHPD